MNEIIKNDNVQYDYEVYICIDEELRDMRAIISHMIIEYGYKQVSEIKDNGNTIITISRKKKQ